MSTYTWTQEGRRWTLDAAPRYAVASRELGRYTMLIDGHEVDEASSAASAFAQLEARYEYEQHSADLEEARHRLQQVRGRLEARYPRAAKDPELTCILEGLEDALGAGPEASEPATSPGEAGTFARQLSPDLVVGTDSAQCIVLLVGGLGPKDPIRTVTVGDVDGFKAALDDARTAQRVAMDEAEQARPDRAEKRRAEGRLTQREAVDWLIGRGWHGIPGLAAHAVRSLREGTDDKPAAAAADEGMTYDGTYWVVPAGTPESGD